MPIRRRGPAWEVTVCYHGAVVRRSSQKWTKEQAREIERAILDRLIAAESGKRTDYTFNDAIARWSKEELPRLRSRRETTYKAAQIAPYIEGQLLTATPEIVAEIKADMAHLKPATVNRRLAVIRRLCSLAYRRWGWLDMPLHQKVELLSERNARHVYLTKQQVEKLAGLMPRSGDYVLLAAYTGVRRGQLFRLTSADAVGDYLHLGADGKTGQPQIIPLHKRVKKIVARLPIPVTQALVRKEWDAARKQSGLEHVRWHDLRHTFASWLIQSGADLMHVREFLGHSTVAVTQRYAHLKAKHLRGALNRI